jgi:hypothetical protein
MKQARFLVALACAVPACQPIEELQQTPPVQASVDAPARWQVFINRVRDGVFRSYSPRCNAEVAPGHVVEFSNFMADVPANVSSIAGPVALYSPNLRRPYNFVPQTEELGAHSYWRFRFETPGVYDWIDTNQGQPGRRVIDPYYGTETFIGIDPNTPIATICVQRPDGTGCENVCCTGDEQCRSGNQCDKSPLEAVGRCRTPSG